MEDDSAHQLDVEETHTDRALERLADGGVGFEDELVQLLAVVEPLPELGGLRGKIGVGELLEFRLEGADVGRLIAQALEAPAFAEPKSLF
jgi:hypothetical protein